MEHEYLDKNGVRTRYIHVKTEDEFQYLVKAKVQADNTTRALRKIEDAEHVLKHLKLVRNLSIAILLISSVLMLIAFWPLIPSQSLATLFGWGGILVAVFSFVSSAFFTTEIWNASAMLRNHRRELEDAMMREGEDF